MFVYADNAATTKLRKTALEAMLPWLEDSFGNASSMYAPARDAKRALEDARKTVAACLGARPDEIYFTSGGTESDNWALQCSVAEGQRLIISAIEHHAVLHTAEALAKAGRMVDILPVNAQGQVEPATLEKALSQGIAPALVSIMAANNEIGTVLDIPTLFTLTKRLSPTTRTHTDAVQAVGHIPLSLEEVDLLSLSAHKFGGPKGVGMLYIRKGVRLPPLLHGGGHERGKRSSTENIAGIVGLAAALLEAVNSRDSAAKQTDLMRNRLIDGILKIPYSFVNGDRENHLPGIASFIFECVEGETLVLGLDAVGICASSGSACSSGSLDPSHVLMAIGLPQEVAHGSLRLSIDETTTADQVDYLVEQVSRVVSQRRAMSPLWNEKTQTPTERFWPDGNPR